MEEVNKKLNDLPAADEILFVDQTAIEEAREAYEALDDLKKNLKDQVSAEALAKLVAAEERLNTLQEELEKSQVRRLEMIPISSSRSPD